MMDSTGELQFREMTAADVDAVVAIEVQVQSHPWTRGMFADALAHGYRSVLMEQCGALAGYAILMPVLDEIHLLDIGIAQHLQKQGFGLKILNKIIMLEKEIGSSKMLLEVRRSNQAALALYRKAGFHEIGVRRGYYPAAAGREDAIVMERMLR
jgi:ribosomal-protein-alanine acetyltransferase